jgi:hypothetical protein
VLLMDPGYTQLSGALQQARRFSPLSSRSRKTLIKEQTVVTDKIAWRWRLLRGVRTVDFYFHPPQSTSYGIACPIRSMALFEPDLRRHEVLTEPERKLNFALLETVFQKKPADFCINTSIENTQFYARDRNGKLSRGRNAKGRRCLAPTPLI